MPSTTNTNTNNLSRNVSFPSRTGSDGVEEYSSDIHNNSSSPKCDQSAFSKGLAGKQAPLDTGLSDDSDLPRLSPIRTSSGTALNTWERKQKLLTTIPKENASGGRCLLSRSCYYEAAPYEKLKGTALFISPGRDSTDLSFMGSHEESSSSLTATSGACSALSEDVWQTSPPCGHTTVPEEKSFDNVNPHILPLLLMKNFVPVVLQEKDQRQRRKSQLGSFFDNLTTTLQRGLSSLAATVERAATNATRELSTNMRRVDETKPDGTFYEVQEHSIDGDDVAEPSTKTKAAVSPADSEPSTTIAVGQGGNHTRTLSYDTSFNMFGGQDFYEQLEFLCNDYAKKLNKLRARLPEVDKGRLEKVVMQLYPVFDVVGSPSESDDEGMAGTIDDRLSHLYAPIDHMVNECLRSVAQKERASVLEIANLCVCFSSPLVVVGGECGCGYRVANPVNVLGSASYIPLTPQTSRCAELYVELESAVIHGRHSAELIHEEGIRRVAELCTKCIQCLFEVALDLSLPPDSPEKIKWPESSIEIGLLLRSFCIRLVHNLEAVTGSFVGALLGVGSAYDENLQDCSVGQKAQGLACDMELDSGTAMTKIQESLRNLLYLVVHVTFES